MVALHDARVVVLVELRLVLALAVLVLEPHPVALLDAVLGGRLRVDVAQGIRVQRAQPDAARSGRSAARGRRR